MSASSRTKANTAWSTRAFSPAPTLTFDRNQISMNNGHIPAAFSMLIEEFERAIHEVNREGARAFEEKRYEDIPALTQEAKEIESFQSRIVSLDDEWSSLTSEPEIKNKKGKWTKQTPSTPVSFHSSCVAKASKQLKAEFTKKTRSSFVSKDGRMAIVVTVSKEYDNGSQRFCWFSFHPYQSEILQSHPNGFLVLGCGSPEKTLVIPYRDFQPWTEKLNKSVRDDDSFYWHIRVVTDEGGFRLKLEGRGNEMDISKYQIKAK